MTNSKARNRKGFNFSSSHSEAAGHKTRMGFNLLPSISEAIGHRARRGFNLIEAAIVLAVVGFVLGGIWWASAKFYEDYRIDKTAEQTLMIYQCVRNKYPRLTCDGVNLCLVSSVTQWRRQTKIIDDFGCIPKDVERRGTNPTLYYDRFGKEFFTVFDNAGGGFARMTLQLGTWPPYSYTVSRCAKLANKIANSVNPNELWDLQTGLHTNYDFLSIGINTWKARCIGGVDSSVYVKFNPV